MNLLYSILVFIVAFFLINLVLPYQTAVLIAVIVAVAVFLGFGRRNNL